MAPASVALQRRALKEALSAPAVSSATMHDSRILVLRLLRRQEWGKPPLPLLKRKRRLPTPSGRGDRTARTGLTT